MGGLSRSQDNVLTTAVEPTSPIYKPAQVRRCDLRQSRYIGLAKTRLLHLLIATALNFVRTAAWLADIPLAHTRRSAFAVLMAEPRAA